MKVSDYIVEFFISKNITTFFGYPGGMVTHLMDSLDKYSDQVCSIVNYNEQGSSFAVSGFGHVCLSPSVAYATSGPGATNMITGICNAYFDSIPSIFITGQVNTYESKDGLEIRQKGFQETDVCSMVEDVTNFCVKINDEKKIRYYLEKAYHYATVGRNGPVLLDIPMDVQRKDIEVEALEAFSPSEEFQSDSSNFNVIIDELKRAKRPIIIAGSGLRLSGATEGFRQLIKKLDSPVVTSMIAIDCLSSDDRYNYGFIGAYGMRYANFIVAKADLIISLGSRLDVRQTGANLANFAPSAKLIRVDIDSVELTRKIKDDEIQVKANLSDLIGVLNSKINQSYDFSSWLKVCDEIRNSLKNIDDSKINDIIKEISHQIPDNRVILADVGQNQVWLAQSFDIKGDQRILFSGGHGAMGYSLPASIGAYYASKNVTYSFNGDGGVQMNIQELQTIAREKLPIKVIILNNSSLGMIRHFQEMYFNSNYFQTKKERGYTVPSFEKIAYAYGLSYHKIDGAIEPNSDFLLTNEPCVIEVILNDTTYVFPKLAMGKPNQDQEPEIDRDLYNKLMAL